MSTPEGLKEITLRGAEGATLAAEVGGDEDAPLVILTHGGGQTRHSWSRSARNLLQKGYAVLSYDHRGHGQSDWSPAAAYTLPDFAADLESILLTLRPGRPVALIGASLGGVASLLAGARHPDRVSALVLVDVSPKVNNLGADRIRTFMASHTQGFATLEEAGEAIAAFRPERDRPDDLRGLAANLRRSADSDRYHWHWDPRLLDSMSRDTREQRSALLEASCRNLSLPTLLVRGLLSDVVSESEAEHFKSLLPHLERVDVAAAGHMVVSDRNDAFLDAILGFLNRLMPLRARAPRPNSGNT